MKFKLPLLMPNAYFQGHTEVEFRMNNIWFLFCALIWSKNVRSQWFSSQELYLLVQVIWGRDLNAHKMSQLYPFCHPLPLLPLLARPFTYWQCRQCFWIFFYREMFINILFYCSHDKFRCTYFNVRELAWGLLHRIQYTLTQHQPLPWP